MSETREQKRDRLRRSKLKRKILSLVVNLLVWCGFAVGYYLIFSALFDTPIEHEMRKTNNTLRRQYEMMSEKYDTLQMVMKDLSDRDENIYGMLFESKPYNEDSITDPLSDIDDSKELLSMSNNEIAEQFFSRLTNFGSQVNNGTAEFNQILSKTDSLGDKMNNFPSIQPIVNRDFSKIAASFGWRIQPFIKTLSEHKGVDFAVPEETRIFATADGVIARVVQGSKGEGLTIDINHKNGYTTTYSHLKKSLVRRGSSVKRGDIIAYSGNSGLSFLPHLHYEVKYNDLEVDPIDFFFYELDPYGREQIERIAQNAMQSLD